MSFWTAQLPSSVSARVAVNHKSSGGKQLRRVRWNKNRHGRTQRRKHETCTVCLQGSEGNGSKHCSLHVEVRKQRQRNWPQQSSRQRRSPAQKWLLGLISCTTTSRVGTFPLDLFTSFTVSSSESKRAVTAEGAPQVHTRPSVQTRVVVAEVSLSRTSWENTKTRMMTSVSVGSVQTSTYKSMKVFWKYVNVKLRDGAPQDVPGTVPLLAMKPAMSMCWLSIRRFFMQPTNSRLRTGKSSGSLGTPPRSRGPVRSRDLRPQSQQLHTPYWPGYLRCFN